METPLINIITRCSRPESFERCRESVESQTYKNVHHIVTYQNDEIKEFLGKFEEIHKVRVPNLKAIKGLGVYMYTHQAKDNFLNPDREWLELEATPNLNEFNQKDIRKPEEVMTVWKDGRWHQTFDYAWKRGYKHFPYNLFIKIAEQHVKEGWVVYLDDDDYLARDTALEELVEEINKHDKDTIHLAYVLQKDGNEGIFGKGWKWLWDQMVDGMPFTVNCVGASMFYYHTKYIEYTGWDEWSGADWRTAKCLEAVIPKKNWIENHFIQLGGENKDGASRGN
jgi:glycosyltransferase involved in cell wall biosynthesis